MPWPAAREPAAPGPRLGEEVDDPARLRPVAALHPSPRAPAPHCPSNSGIRLRTLMGGRPLSGVRKCGSAVARPTAGNGHRKMPEQKGHRRSASPPLPSHPNRAGSRSGGPGGAPRARTFSGPAGVSRLILCPAQNLRNLRAQPNNPKESAGSADSAESADSADSAERQSPRAGTGLFRPGRRLAALAAQAACTQAR